MPKKYSSLDDALTLLGLLTSVEDATDEQALSVVEAATVEDYQTLVLALAGIASGLILNISDEFGTNPSQAFINLAAARDELEED